jgi:hypothetical protein
MTHTFHDEIITFDKGIRVKIVYQYDEDSDAPWDNSDGHGPVRKGHGTNYHGYAAKSPGERPLNHRGWNTQQYFYDWAKACEMAKKDGWNAEPYDAPNRIERAVQADFDFLSSWLNDDWHYAIVTCGVIDEDGDPIKEFEDCCGGYETYKDYHLTAGREMADELAKRYAEELAERAHWEERGVVTEAA